MQGEDLIRRIDNLERQNRYMKKVGSLVLLTLVGVILMGLAIPESKVVEAERFILKNKKGVALAKFSILPDGYPHLMLYDKKETLRMMMGICVGKGFAYDRPYLTLLDDDNKARARLSLGESGNPSLLYYDGEQEGQSVTLGMSKDGLSFLGFHKENGGISLGIDESGMSHLRFYKGKRKRLELEPDRLCFNDPDGGSVMRFNATYDGEPYILLTGHEKLESGAFGIKGSVKIGIKNKNSPFIGMGGWDEKFDDYASFHLGETETKNQKTGLMEIHPLSSIELRNPNEEVVWKVPQ